MHIGISLLLVAFFLAMNAFFVIAEFAMVRVRPSQIEMALQEGKFADRDGLAGGEAGREGCKARH